MTPKRKSTSNSLGGRKANAKGGMFESIIEVTCHYYRRQGKADIQKTPEPMRVIRPINREKRLFEAQFDKRAQPDFKGVKKGGQMVIFEAKRTESTNISLDRITPVQANNFRTCEELGAECFVLVSFNERHFYKVPWHVWDNAQETHKKKSLNQKDLAAYEVPYLNGMIQFL